MSEDMPKQFLPAEVLAAETPERAAELLGPALGLNGPAPLAATKKALSEPLFARALWNFRKVPGLRDPLLADPEAMQVGPEAPSSAGLVRKAAGAVLKWGMEGMRPAEAWVISKRLDACNACEFHVPAPDTLVYRGAKVVVGKDAKICRSCHCLTNTKAAISTEMCPEKDPDNPDLSRWGEPWVPVEKHPEGPW